VFVEWHEFTFYYITMTDMEEIDSTEWEQKKSGYAALREKHAEEVNALKAEIEELKAGRMADKKLYFENTMKNRGYEWDFWAFADKYSTLDINDMVSLYEWQNWKKVVEQPKPETNSEVWAKSVIAWANPTTEVNAKKLSEMTPQEIIAYAKKQPRYK